jgi:AbrB family looped-hinge helix DNA binding protein
MILGAIRKVDKFGRVQIPLDIRKEMGLEEDTEVNVIFKDERIVIYPTREGSWNESK